MASKGKILRYIRSMLYVTYTMLIKEFPNTSREVITAHVTSLIAEDEITCDYHDKDLFVFKAKRKDLKRTA